MCVLNLLWLTGKVALVTGAAWTSAKAGQRAIQGFVERVACELVPIDILVNNIGIGSGGRCWRIKRKQDATEPRPKAGILSEWFS